MSMYDLAMSDGKQHERFKLFAHTFLNMGHDDVGRFRDCWVEEVDGRLIIAVYTRNGGGNRPDYEDVSQHLASHPQYIDDEDDAFDVTYRTYRFWMPTECPPHLKGVGEGVNSWEAMSFDSEILPMIRLYAHQGRRDMSAEWNKAIDAMKNGSVTPKQQAAADQLGAALRDALDPNRKPGDGPTIIHI